MSYDEYLIFVPPDPKFIPTVQQIMDFDKHLANFDILYSEHFDIFRPEAPEIIKKKIQAYSLKSQISHTYSFRWNFYEDILKNWFEWTDEDFLGFFWDEEPEDKTDMIVNPRENLELIVDKQASLTFGLEITNGFSRYIDALWPNTLQDTSRDEYIMFKGHMALFFHFVNKSFLHADVDLSNFYTSLFKIKGMRILKQAFEYTFQMTPDIKLANMEYLDYL